MKIPSIWIQPHREALWVAHALAGSVQKSFVYSGESNSTHGLTKSVFEALLEQGTLVIVIAKHKLFDFDVEVLFSKPAKPGDKQVFLDKLGFTNDRDKLVEATLRYMKEKKLILTAFV